MEIPMQSDFLLEILQMKSDFKDCLLMVAGVLLTELQERWVHS